MILLVPVKDERCGLEDVCICQRVRDGEEFTNFPSPVVVIEQAWNQIQDPATKEMYDKFRGKNGYASLFPCKGVPSHSYPPSAPSKEMPEVYPYHTLDFILSNVAGTNISWAIDRAADSVFCRKRPNTFWTSLSQGLLGDSKFC